MTMFRTHLGRSIDLSSTSNRLMLALVAAAAVAGVAVWATSDGSDAWLAPGYAFLIWAIARELDPDRYGSALLAGAVAGAWVIFGLEVAGLLEVVGFLMAGRLVLNPVGLRPLTTDLAAMVVLAAVVSLTAAGWVAGFGIALGLYIDARMADEPRTASVVAAVAAALAATAVATAAGALPERMPDVQPLLTAIAGLLALFVVAREPPPVRSPVDHRPDKSMETERLHAARVLTMVLVFVAIFLTGQGAVGFGPVVVAVAIVLTIEEAARLLDRAR